MSKAYALFLSGEGSPSVKVFASAKEARSNGNGFLIVESAEDIANSSATSAQLVALYNSIAKNEVKSFHDKQTAALRVFKLLETEFAGIATSSVNEEAQAAVDEVMGTNPEPSDAAQAEGKKPSGIKRMKDVAKTPRQRKENAKPRIRLEGRYMKLTEEFRNAGNPHREGTACWIAWEAMAATGDEFALREDWIRNGAFSAHIAHFYRDGHIILKPLDEESKAA